MSQKKEERRWKVFTPSGVIYTNSLQDRIDYKKMYGYFYQKNENYKPE